MIQAGRSASLLAALAGLVLALGCPSFLAAAERPDLLVLTTQVWPPYVVERGSLADGLAVAPLVCALDSLDQPYRIDFLPWIRAQQEVRLGRAQGFFPASSNADRDGYAVFSGALVTERWAWYFRKDSKLKPDDPAFKQEASVTSEAGSNLVFWLEEEGYRVAPAPDTHGQLALMLQRKRIDAALATKAVFEASLWELAVDSSLFQEQVVKEKRLGVYFAKGFLERFPDFLPAFNAALADCR